MWYKAIYNAFEDPDFAPSATTDRPVDQVADDHSYYVHSAASNPIPAWTQVADSDSPESQDGRSTETYAPIPITSHGKKMLNFMLQSHGHQQPVFS